MSHCDDEVHYFNKDGSNSDNDQGYGYFSLKKNCLHAIDKPALINQEGSIWMVNGKLHREDGPAVEKCNGRKEWWLNDKRHRVDGPAIVSVSGDMQYYENGKCSRKDGPAVENVDGYKEYWVDGKQLSEEDFVHKYSIKNKLKIK